MGKDSHINEFVSLLSHNAKAHVKVQTCWVKAKVVDWGNKTMVAEGLTDGLDFNDINLGVGHLYRKPKQGSVCLIGLIENKEAAAFLIDAEEVEEYVLNVNESLFKIDLNGFEIKKGNVTLKKILDEVVSQMLKIYAPKDVAGITAIKTSINNLLSS